MIAVASGKGGVGKSSITVNLAVALARRGLTVGVLDADIWGFSVPRLLGMQGDVEARDKKMVPLERRIGDGVIRVLSMGFLAEEDSAVMWRGLILNRAVQHFLEDVHWGDLDYLLIDMPPGTGDIQMGLARMVPRTEVIVVTTPPVAAQKVAARTADMARKGYLRVAGVIENMSDFTCEHGTSYALFGTGGGARLADEVGVPLIGQIPLHPAVAAGGDAGTPVALDQGHPLAEVFDRIAESMITTIAPVVAMEGCSARLLDRVEEAVQSRYDHRSVTGPVAQAVPALGPHTSPTSSARSSSIGHIPSPVGPPRPLRSPGHPAGAPAPGRPRRERRAARSGTSVIRLAQAITSSVDRNPWMLLRLAMVGGRSSISPRAWRANASAGRTQMVAMVSPSS